MQTGLSDRLSTIPRIIEKHYAGHNGLTNFQMKVRRVLIFGFVGFRTASGNGIFWTPKRHSSNDFCWHLVPTRAQGMEWDRGFMVGLEGNHRHGHRSEWHR